MHTVAFCIPKCANTSIKRAFMDVLSKTGNPHGPNKFLTISKWTAAYKYPKFFKFAFVRNPYARLVSCYVDKVASENFHYPFSRFGIHASTGFREFVEIICKLPDFLSDQHFRSQYYELVITDDVKQLWLVPDFIGHVETIETDWPKVIKKVEKTSGMRLPSLPQERRTGAGNEWQEFFDRHTRGLVQDRYYEDFKVFGYDY